MELRRRKHPLLRGLLMTAGVFAALILCLMLSLNAVSSRTTDEQANMLKEAVLRATMTCYAVEGRYPLRVEELEDNYGITYDNEKYIVVIDGFAQNVLPEIRVLQKGEMMP